MAGGFESPLTDSEVGTDTNTDKDLDWWFMGVVQAPSAGWLAGLGKWFKDCEADTTSIKKIENNWRKSLTYIAFNVYI